MFKLALAFVSLVFTLQDVACRPFVEAPADLVVRGTDVLSGLGLREVQDENIEADAAEFIGFHGTNSQTATFWEKQGFISKPPSPDNSVWDYIGGLITGTGGSSGADAELGPGLYVTDDPHIALAFANNNAQVNKGTTPKVCAISAKSSGNWRVIVNKVFLPENTGLIGDSSDATRKAKFENARTKYINIVRPGAQASSTVRFSLLDRNAKTGQLVLPNPITQLFSAKCFTYDGKTLPSGVHSGFPAFSYNSNTVRSQWKITPENTDAAKVATS
ncbi:hypothetical protein CPB84DRAFT_1969153 [Gymnopilus junonius]|uniref:Uncharacterized protein n=1 Tax=Gymnopilus junonius TaxID=109634 RepID=A0A9P5TEF0_GYMJU|nr:hypothetical protein CPB84DRAFT_1969153 [Gymnopilus junonius]